MRKNLAPPFGKGKCIPRLMLPPDVGSEDDLEPMETLNQLPPDVGSDVEEEELAANIQLQGCHCKGK